MNNIPSLATGVAREVELSLNFGDIHTPLRSFTVCKLICVRDEKRELFKSPLTDDHSRPAGSRMSCAPGCCATTREIGRAHSTSVKSIRRRWPFMKLFLLFRKHCKEFFDPAKLVSHLSILQAS